MSALSPCIGVCQMDAQRRYCVGCWRTLAEISQWSTLSVQQRLDCMQQLPQRQPAQPLRALPDDDHEVDC